MLGDAADRIKVLLQGSNVTGPRRFSGPSLPRRENLRKLVALATLVVVEYPPTTIICDHALLLRHRRFALTELEGGTLVLILGCGYVGRRLASRLLDDRDSAGRLDPNETLTCVARNPDPLQPLADDGARVLALDLMQDALAALPTAGERVFHFAPPVGEDRQDSLTARLVDAFQRLGHPRRLVYISTTGVYGDCGGAWVDESWPLRPLADRSFRRLDAEQRLRAWSEASGADLVILRVAGIYGPDRLPLARIKSGQPLVRLEDAPWSNRIHVDDLVEVCLAAVDRAPAGAVYNVCDGHPSTMTDYFFQIADRVGLPRPPQIPMAAADGKLSPGMLSYMRESRRLSNRRMCDELGIRLRYPTLESGLAELSPAD